MTTRPGGFADPGNCHRIALAVEDFAGAMDQWQRVFGAGVMFDATHDDLDGGPRNGLSPTGGGDGLVQVGGVAYVTAIVVEMEPVAALLRTVFGAEPRPVANDGPEAISEFDVGDLTLRVIAPHDESSEWHHAVANGRGTLYSVTLAVDLDTAPAGLETAAIRIAREERETLWLDPSDTF